MSDHVEFVCPICGEEFALSDSRWSDASRLLLCPCCGATGVTPWDPFGERPESVPGRAA